MNKSSYYFILFSICYSTMSDHIPEEIVLLVLSKLDVLTLIDSRAVCRRWKALIDSTTAVNRLHTHCLVGYFLENVRSTVSESPYFVKAAVIALWTDANGSVTAVTNPHHPGFWLFSFADSNTLDAVIKYGPWFIAERPIFLRRWRPYLNLVRDSFETVPFWVTFHGFPIGCWKEKVWTALTRLIGVMVPVQGGEMEPSRVQNGRICVEVSAKEPPIVRYFMRVEDGRVFLVFVEYGWMPLRCDWCKVFGHDLTNCALSAVYGERSHGKVNGKNKTMVKGKGKAVWVPKNRDQM